MTAWSEAHEILALRLDAAGDVLMTTPAIRALRESGRGRRITLLTSPAGERVARLVPELDDVIVYEAPWMKASAGGRHPETDLDLVAELRERRFDAAVVFTVYSQNPLPAALLCYLAGIPLRLAHCRENPYQLLTDWIRETEPEHGTRHEVQRQLDLVGHVGSVTTDAHLSLRVPAEASRRAYSQLHGAGLRASEPWAVIHPGASAPSRRYAPERFAEVARQLQSEHGMQVVFTGGPEEVETVDRVRDGAGVPSISMAGDLDLAELAAVIEAAPLLISNNTGPVHIAAAVGTPVVDLYALTNPQHTPWMTPNRVLFRDVPCSYCYRSVCPEGHHHCLALVEPAEVVRAARELLAEVTLGGGVH